MKFVAADIGGTKSWLCLCETNSDLASGSDVVHNAGGNNLAHHVVRYEKIYPSSDFSDFSALLTHFLDDAQTNESNMINTLCLALPGVISDRHARLTNLDWELDIDNLQREFNIKNIRFVNDFQAAAMGTTTLETDNPDEIFSGTVPAILIEATVCSCCSLKPSA